MSGFKTRNPCYACRISQENAAFSFFNVYRPAWGRAHSPEGIMGLQLKVTDINTVPEALRSAYVQKDGAWHLDVEGGVVPEADVKGLKDKNNELLGEKKKALADLQAVLDTAKMTDEERTRLKARVDELESQVMTKEELAAKAVKKAKEEAEGEKAKVKAQADHFQKLFTDSTIKATLFGAAQEAGAYSAEQIHGLLAGRTVLEEVRDDEGKPTGQYVPKTTVTVLDGDKRIEKTLPAAEAVKAFLEQPENKNLVNSKALPGGGARQGGPNPGTPPENMTSTAKIAAGLRARGLS
jgi:hypothetical protein